VSRFEASPPTRAPCSERAGAPDEIAINSPLAGHLPVMATVLGAGSSLAMTLGSPRGNAVWFLDAGFVSVPRSAGAPPNYPLAGSPRSPASRPENVHVAPAPPADPRLVSQEPPETLDLLARIVWLLGSAASGLPLSDLRTHLSEPAGSLQRALAAGLRTKRLRRLGAHNKLRYVLNT
jgi:hypothetical protein